MIGVSVEAYGWKKQQRRSRCKEEEEKERKLGVSVERDESGGIEYNGHRRAWAEIWDHCDTGEPVKHRLRGLSGLRYLDMQPAGS